tara:strand:- start:4321 stop:5229 length:909 start_codon:yes stop_codon:yes gene_type:complete
MNILITGANGYLAKQIISELKEENSIIGFSTSYEISTDSCDIRKIHTLEDIGDSYFAGIDIFIHTANIAHKSIKNRDYEVVQKVNFDLSCDLFKKACNANVKRIIFLSSVAVYGSSTDADGVFETTNPSPDNFYGICKLKAEKALKSMAINTNTGITILRMPMVIGKDSPGSSESLRKFFKKASHFPLLLPDNGNKRTLCNSLNVSETIKKIMSKSKSPEIINVCNKDTVSTFEILNSFSKKKNKIYRLEIKPCFDSLLKKIPLLGKVYAKAYSNFVVNSLYDEEFKSPIPVGTAEQIKSYS